MARQILLWLIQVQHQKRRFDALFDSDMESQANFPPCVARRPSDTSTEDDDYQAKPPGTLHGTKILRNLNRG